VLRILEILNENTGIMKDTDLYEALRREFDISYREMMRYLMMLEIRGYIHVSSSRENLRVISLNPRVKEYLASRA
jgi:Fe2+ or Zn2+ uptake regulation protein